MRLPGVFLFTFLLFSALIFRFFQIQILQGEKWERQAKLQHECVVKEPFKRGTFYSNASIKMGHPELSVALAMDVSRFHLYVDPEVIPPQLKSSLISNLKALLQLSPQETEKMEEQFAKKSRSRKIASWLSAERKGAIETWWNAFSRNKKVPRNAIYFIEDFKRSHPFGKLLGQVLHTVREKRDEKTLQAIPTGGLELYFQSYLEGKEGKRLLLRAPKYSLENDESLEAPENGADVYLTINHILQAIAEEEIEKGVKKAGAKGGYALMMDPFSGEILAMAQYPFFDPENYRDYFSDEEKINQTKVKAFSDCNEPGSTFKPITALLALIANDELKSHGKRPLFNPEEILSCDRGDFPGRSKPVKDVRLHRKLNLYMAIQKSSNIYVAKLAQKIVETMGESWYHDKLKELFGFGERTGIEFPSESPGFLPKPGKSYANGQPQWSLPTPYSLAMGYNLLVTGIQLAKAYAIIANGGFQIKPTLIKKIVKKRSEESEEILYTAPLLPFRRVISQDVYEEVLKALKYCTMPGGCGILANVKGFTEVGKSGTSEKIIGGSYSTKIHFSSFIGFAPARYPRFVLLIGIDEPEYRFIPGLGRTHYGGKCAAPVFQEIARKSLEYLGAAPDDPHGYPAGDPRSDPEKEHWGKENRRLKQLYDKLN